MPDLQRSDIIKIDLSKQLLRTNAGEILAMGDDCANRFGADLVRNGLPVNVDGCMVIGYFIRPDGYTCVIEGVAEGSQAYVDLPEACYTSEGVFSLAIKLKNDEMNCTLRIIDGYLRRTETGTYIDPGTVVPDLADLLLQIEAMEDATAAANTATENANNAAELAGNAADAANQAADAANESTVMEYANQAQASAEEAAASATAAAASAAQAQESAAVLTVDQTVTEGSENPVSGGAVKTYVDSREKSNGVTITVAASAWEGSAAPYTATVTCSIATASNILAVSPAGQANSAAQRAAITAALITATGQGAGSITLTADGEKPETDIAINVVEVI